MMEPGWPFGNRPTPRRVWTVWKAGQLTECEINAHPLGFELRLYVGGDFYYSRAFENVEATEAEAVERKRELIAAGWTDRPPMPN